jgi:hypothetical protein
MPPRNRGARTTRRGGREHHLIAIAASICFGAGGNAQACQVSGWSNPEPRWTWCTGRQARLRIPIAPGAGRLMLEVALEPFVKPPELPCQRLDIVAGGQLAGTAAIGAASLLGFLLPHGAAPANGALDIVLRCPDAAPPSRFGASQDSRQLGFNFRTIRLFWLPEATPVFARGMPPVPAGPGELPASLEASAQALTGLKLDDVMLRFESIGHNCEFGLVQRRCGAEPLGLLRFVGVTLENLIQAIDETFAGLDNPANTRIYPGSENNWEWVIQNTRYDMAWHSFLPVATVSEAAARRQEMQKQAFKLRRFMDVLRGGQQIFIYHHAAHDQPMHVLPLLAALRRHGDNALLFVAASSLRPSGSVDRLDRNLYRGNIGRFLPIGQGDDANFFAWLSIAINAVRLWREVHDAD